MSALELNSLLTVLFIALVIIGFIVANAVQDQRQVSQRVHQRIVASEDAFVPEATGLSLVRLKYLTTLSPWEQALEALPGMMSLEQTIEQSGRFFPAYRLVLLSVALGGIAAAITARFANEPIFLGLAFFVAFWLPVKVLKHLRDKRLAKFEEQLPDALDMMVRAMRAGHRFNDTLNLVSAELSEPIASEFGIVFDELNYGVDMRLAFSNLLSRVPSVSLMAMSTSVLVQRESGGNLAEILQSISTVIRNRFKFQRRVKTLTAEGKASVVVLGVIPFALFALLEVTNPDYVNVLFTDPLGPKIIGGGLGMMVLGGIWIQKMLRIDV
jgi:tight adherence protein B